MYKLPDRIPPGLIPNPHLLLHGLEFLVCTIVKTMFLGHRAPNANLLSCALVWEIHGVGETSTESITFSVPLWMALH